MAEAHSAVAFSFSITHDGYNINYNREVLDLVWESGVRSWKKRLARFRNGIRNGVYPAHLQSLWIVISVAVALHCAGRSVPFDLVNRVLPLLPAATMWWQLVACSLAGLAFWLCICYTMRYTLKFLLMYKGWMYESRGAGSRISLRTRLWAGATKVLSSWNKPGLYSFQGSLPRLPLPAVRETTQRYLRSVRPLLDDAAYAHMERLAAEFESSIGGKLQRYLHLKSWWTTNYVSDWWEEYVYLRGRSALMVNSNFYGIDAIYSRQTEVQAARAANISYLLLIFRRQVERQELEPIMVQGLVPLCSWQYERIFNTVRVPGQESDKIVHYKDSNHIVVLHRGCYYKVIIYHRQRLLRPCELQLQMEAILQAPARPAAGEERLAALTAGNRHEWSAIRETVFARGVNRASLHAVESAAFVLSLDAEPFEFDLARPEKLDHFGRVLLHGNGSDRWFDKSFTVCVGTNGRIGFNAEHTWGDAAVMSHIWEHNIMMEAELDGADAPVMAHMWEHVFHTESMKPGYDEQGNCKGVKEFDPPVPARLPWSLDAEVALPAIERAHEAAQELIADIDLRILVHDQFGKGLMKKCRISPDAFIQMALQLAYYRDAGKFSLTYEASMTRLYREGRTETVRPCTIESSAFVLAMQDGGATDAAERVRLLMAACGRHQLGYQDAMCGKGIDRHLFCLYVVSKYLEVQSPFLEAAVVNAKWQLSTSQTPHGQTSMMDLKKHPDCISAGGGFGPVADDGYGVSYIIAGEDLMFFHISSKKGCAKTNSNRFALEIIKSLDDIKLLFEEFNSQKKKTASSNGTASMSPS